MTEKVWSAPTFRESFVSTVRTTSSVPAGASRLRPLMARGFARSAERNSTASTWLVEYRRDTPSACRNVMVRAAMPTTVPWTRVPFLMINVSADEIAASDMTHRLIAVAMTILLI
jgi:hypothetical protein